MVPCVYTVPLILSPQSKQPIRNAAGTAAQKASATAADVRDKVQGLDLQGTKGDAADKVSSTVSNLKGEVEDMTKNATNNVSFIADNSLSSDHISNDGAGRIPSNSRPTINIGEPSKPNNMPHYTADTPASTGTSDSRVTYSSNEQGELLAQNNKPHATHIYEMAPPEGGNISATKINPGATDRDYPSTGEALFG